MINPITSISGIVEELERNLVELNPSFSVVTPRHAILVNLDMENAEADGNLGEIWAESNGQSVNMKVAMFPAHRISERAIHLMAIRVYCAAVASTYGLSSDEALLDAMLLSYLRILEGRKIYNATATRYYRDAYRIRSAAGCDEFLDTAISSHIAQRETRANQLITPAVKLIIATVKARGDESDDEILNHLFKALCYSTEE